MDEECSNHAQWLERNTTQDFELTADPLCYPTEEQLKNCGLWVIVARLTVNIVEELRFVTSSYNDALVEARGLQEVSPSYTVYIYGADLIAPELYGKYAKRQLTKEEDTELEREPAPGQIWRHNNGFDYEIAAIGEFNDTDPHIPVVVHRGLHDGRVWVRTVENFLGTHRTGVPRYTRIR